MPKQTQLSEHAEIYKRRENKTEKEKLKEMSFQNKVGYLWEYYRFHALIGIAVIALFAYIIHTIITPKIETQLYIAMVNNPISKTNIEELQVDLAELLQLDPEKENVVINTNFYFDGNLDYEMNMRQVLVTYIASQDVDVIIAPESEFYSYAHNSFLYPLSDLLPTDIYSSLTDQFYLAETADDPAEKTVFGIYVSDLELYKNNIRYEGSEPYIIGVVANTRHQGNSVEFIRHLFN